jgi:hypothetical protein
LQSGTSAAMYAVIALVAIALGLVVLIFIRTACGDQGQRIKCIQLRTERQSMRAPPPSSPAGPSVNRG